MIVIASLWTFLQNMVTWYKKDLAGWQATQLRGKKKNKEVTGIPPGYYKCGPQLLS